MTKPRCPKCRYWDTDRPLITTDAYHDPLARQCNSCGHVWRARPENVLDHFTIGYLTAALWVDDPNPRSGEFCERDGWSIENIDPKSLQSAIDDCEAFQQRCREALDEVTDTFHVDDDRHGTDFWLTRNRHGAGFWDRGYGELGDRLTEACRPYGTVNVFGPETNDQGSAEPDALARWDGVIYLE